jgi:hypothetical protein
MNKYTAKDWPSKLYRKIDVYHNREYLWSSNAYATLKDARLGAADTLKVSIDSIKSEYGE